jgi:hypothetical protein
VVALADRWSRHPRTHLSPQSRKAVTAKHAQTNKCVSLYFLDHQRSVARFGRSLRRAFELRFPMETSARQRWSDWNAALSPETKTAAWCFLYRKPRTREQTGLSVILPLARFEATAWRTASESISEPLD